jgi:hypothetical protein
MEGKKEGRKERKKERKKEGKKERKKERKKKKKRKKEICTCKNTYFYVSHLGVKVCRAESFTSVCVSEGD